ncbi:hypothetical protein T07_11174 [Trichinella nelsoni]|uniref:Uncharacterized protein n=1 Tax=Trichinella nelsoni TaxID=6336 RepID=A0A0V0S709_9BILA|nr:hypothetical protein T07_11174 [Trichinella nelsoni]
MEQKKCENTDETKQNKRREEGGVPVDRQFQCNFSIITHKEMEHLVVDFNQDHGKFIFCIIDLGTGDTQIKTSTISGVRTCGRLHCR